VKTGGFVGRRVGERACGEVIIGGFVSFCCVDYRTGDKKSRHGVTARRQMGRLQFCWLLIFCYIH